MAFELSFVNLYQSLVGVTQTGSFAKQSEALETSDAGLLCHAATHRLGKHGHIPSHSCSSTSVYSLLMGLFEMQLLSHFNV